MSSRSWTSRDKKTTSKRYLKNLGKPFRKSIQKDSKQSREWSKLKKKLRRMGEHDSEEQNNESS